MGLRQTYGAPLALVGAIAWSCAVAPRAIADARVDFRWDAPKRCPGRSWVISRVQRFLGGDLKAVRDAELSFSVSVSETGAGVLSAEVSVVSPHGRRQRRMSDRDCVVVADAVAFIVARAIDSDVQPGDAVLTAEEIARANQPNLPSQPKGTTPGTVGDGQATVQGGTASGAPRGRAQQRGTGEDTPQRRADNRDGGPPDSSIESAEGSQNTEEEETEDSDDDTERTPPGPPVEIDWALGAHLALASEPLPSLGPNFSARAAVLVGTIVRIELALGYSPPQAKDLASDRSVEASFDQIGGALAACAVFGRFGSALGGCVEFQLGVVRGTGLEFRGGREANASYGALVAGPVLIRQLTDRLALRIHLAPVIPLMKPRFTVLQEGRNTRVHAIGAVGFFGSSGVEMRFD